MIILFFAKNAYSFIEQDSVLKMSICWLLPCPVHGRAVSYKSDDSDLLAPVSIAVWYSVQNNMLPK
jgi:hypothetical protein